MSTPQFQDLQKKIRLNGQLSGGPAYWDSATSVFQHARLVRHGNAMSAVASSQNATEEVGDHPVGFGKGFIWDRADEAILLVLFINAADPLGISISGTQPGDYIRVSSAAGIASFTEDEGNPTASSLVGLVGAGAKVILGIGGFPEAVPLVDAAESFAKDQFKATHAKHMRRDAFGVDPGDGLKARAEGGILVSLPQSGGPWYSGDSDHQERWIKKPGDRTIENAPPHISFAFFPVRDPVQSTWQISGNGEVYVTPWDWRFDDNAGFYKVFVQISKGVLPSPPPIQ